MHTSRIPLRNVIPGMIAARDITNEAGIILISRGKVLTPNLIQNLKNNNIYYITIARNTALKSPKINDCLTKIISKTDKKKADYDKFIKYQIFSEARHTLSLELENYLNTIIATSEKIDTDYLLSSTMTLMEKEPNLYQLLKMLTSISDYDDATYSHCINVSLICRIIGTWLNLSDYDNDILTLCGLLHDIGKLKIPHEIIVKPSKLTEEEFAIIKTHTSLGYSLLKDQPIDPRIKNAALMHHERNDGLGYPQSLHCEQIDDFSKIVAIADVYDALTSIRPYRKPITPFGVYDEFKDEGLTRYDPRYTNLFFQHLLDSYITEQVELSNGKTGNIVMIKKDTPSRPVIRTGNDYIDLNKHPDISIKKILE